MKIIKAGVVREVIVVHTGTCSKCGCEIECEKEELLQKTETFGVGFMERDEIVDYVICPTKNCFTHINTTKKIFQ